MKGACRVVVRGTEHTWSFTFPADPKHLPEWRADGLEVYEVLNRVPEWAQRMGLTRPWVAVQDSWRWMRLW